MTQQTIRLFIKATIVGILINIGVAQVPNNPIVADHTITIQDEATLFQQPTTSPELNNHTP